MSRDTIWVVTESRGGIPGPHIPSLGNPTSASDLFRVVGIHRTGHERVNSCYTDVATCQGLARLVEGPVESIEDLERAETALQVLLWHDRVDVMIPGFRYRMGSLDGYARFDEPRSELAFELFRPCDAYDTLYAVEEVAVQDRIVRSSSLQGSAVIGEHMDDLEGDYLRRQSVQAAALSSIPVHMGAPAYFNDPALQPFTNASGFFNELYSTIAQGWAEAVEVVPSVGLSVKLPPILAIVLDRASRRSEIPDAITELREEVAPVRTELVGFNELVTGALDQRELESRCRAIKESFQAVVPASRFEAPSVVLPLLKLYRAVRTPLDWLISALNPAYRPEDPRIIANRTVTGRIFRELLRTDSMHSSLTHFFSESELRSLDRSLLSRS